MPWCGQHFSAVGQRVKLSLLRDTKAVKKHLKEYFQIFLRTAGKLWDNVTDQLHFTKLLHKPLYS